MSIDKVRTFLKEKGLADRIKEFDDTSATVELAAKAVGCEPARIAKTLSFLLNSDLPILIVAAGDAKVDNKKYKEQFNQKAKMIPWDNVEEYTGYAPGGVCPFVPKNNVSVYLDVSLKRFDTVYPAAGSSTSAVELSIPELETLSSFLCWIDVCKDWQS